MVAHQRAAALGEARHTFGETCALLPAAAGRRPSSGEVSAARKTGAGKTSTAAPQSGPNEPHYHAEGPSPAVDFQIGTSARSRGLDALTVPNDVWVELRRRAYFQDPTQGIEHVPFRPPSKLGNLGNRPNRVQNNAAWEGFSKIETK